VGKVRGRGRKPEGECITSEYTEGDVRLRRAIFRKLKALCLERYSELKYLAENNEEGFDLSFLEIFEEMRGVKAVYLNNEQKERAQNSSASSSSNEDSKDDPRDVSVIAKVMYKYSKGAMEKFFLDPRLNMLFEYFADEIKARGHTFSEKRGRTPMNPEQ
jgi:hypothetical protein